LALTYYSIFAKLAARRGGEKMSKYGGFWMAFFMGLATLGMGLPLLREEEAKRRRRNQRRKSLRKVNRHTHRATSFILPEKISR